MVFGKIFSGIGHAGKSMDKKYILMVVSGRWF
jgi:hypothetical protein